MNIPRIHTFSTREEAAKHLAGVLREECLDTKQPLLLLFSGGSALSVTDYLPASSDAAFLTLSVVDERDDPSKKASNFQELKRTPWFQKMMLCGASSIDPLTDNHLSTEKKALAFERTLRQWKENHRDGSIIVILGMGADGHTAGIFPAQEAEIFDQLFQGDAWVIGYTVPEAPSCPTRITATLTFLQQEAAKVYVFLCGQEKATTWEHLLANDIVLSTLPILGIYGMRQVAIYTDLSSGLQAQKS